MSGDLTETRAKELIGNGYDGHAQINESRGQLVFNSATLTILKKEAIDEQVVKIIKKMKLSQAQESRVAFMSKSDLVRYINRESLKEGELDFWSKLNADQEKSVGIQVDGFYVQKQHAAIYLWGKSVAELGIETLQEASELLIGLKGEQNKMVMMHLESGFNKIVNSK